MWMEAMDTTGRVWKTDVFTTRQMLNNHEGDIEKTLKAVESIEELYRNFRSLNYISLLINGRTYFFNPANLVYVRSISAPNRSNLEWAKGLMDEGKPDPEMDDQGFAARY